MKIAKITSVLRSRLINNSYKGWLVKGESVLDIGCGTGVVANELDKKYFFNRLVGCDIQDYRMVPVKFKMQNLPNKLPFKFQSFDKAMFNDVLHHIKFAYQDVLIRESLRVAKSVLIFELIPSITSKYGDYFINKIHNPLMKTPFTYKTQEEWESFFKDMNLIVEKKSVQHPLWYPFRHIAYKITEN